MKTTRFWWMVVGACAFACEAADEVDVQETPAGADDDVCVTEEGSCGPDDLAVAAVHEGPCGSHPTAAEVAVMERDFEERLAAAPPQARIQATIDVYVHVIHRTNGTGKVLQTKINEQMTVLNDSFAGTGFSFALQGLEYIANDDWYYMYMDSPAESEMKSMYRQGGPADLNIYLAATMGGYIGWSAFPWNLLFDPIDDGIVLHNGTLPGGWVTDYNAGDTLVHEVGHWLGLYHTFQNGCGWFGDFVSDTPAEKSAANDCPVGRNTCSATGVDPIYNYMDYTDDVCRREFTTNQKSRMASQFSTWRD